MQRGGRTLGQFLLRLKEGFLFTEAREPCAVTFSFADHNSAQRWLKQFVLFVLYVRSTVRTGQSELCIQTCV
jgi:hypothetical protein